MLLPSTTTKKDVHRALKEVPEFPCYRTFVRIWDREMPFLKIMKKGTDFCDFCCFIDGALSSFPDQATELNAALELHLCDAKRERDLYNRQCEASKKSFSTPSIVQAAQYRPVLHLSFDYAQSIPIPTMVKQPSGLYFRSELKVRLLGIAEEGNQHRINIIMPEGSYPAAKAGGGKGSNCVISMLHYYLRDHTTRQMTIHSDGCCGQGKNQ